MNAEEFLYFGGLALALSAAPIAVLGMTTVAAVVGFISLGWSGAAIAAAFAV